MISLFFYIQGCCSWIMNLFIGIFLNGKLQAGKVNIAQAYYEYLQMWLNCEYLDWPISLNSVVL